MKTLAYFSLLSELIYYGRPRNILKTHYIDFDKELTEDQLKELEEAENAVPDEDCPELTDEHLRQFKRVSERRRKQSDLKLPQKYGRI